DRVNRLRRLFLRDSLIKVDHRGSAQGIVRLLPPASLTLGPIRLSATVTIHRSGLYRLSAQIIGTDAKAFASSSFWSPPMKIDRCGCEWEVRTRCFITSSCERIAKSSGSALLPDVLI